MKTKKCVSAGITALLAVCFLAGSIWAADKPNDQSTDQSVGRPEAVVSNPVYEFANILEGETVTHSFQIQNKGDADLKIIKVKTGWGCTAADYPRQIPPGGEGKIDLKVSTAGKGGHAVRQRATIITNDPEHKELILTITGTVEQYASVNPKRVRFKGPAGKSLITSVMIIPEIKYPFKITEVTAVKGKDISFKLEQTEHNGAPAYKVVVENLMKDKGNYSDTLSVKTDNEKLPPIKISVFGNITDPAPAPDPS